MTLVCAYYWSQIILTVIAFGAAAGAAFAAKIAYDQLQTSQKFELVKILEDAATRKARWRLFHEIDDTQDNWWEKPEFEEVASTVCATFDIVGIMSMPGGRNRAFFTKEWAHSITWTHKKLDRYLKARGKNKHRPYPGYEGLYEEVARLSQ